MKSPFSFPLLIPIALNISIIFLAASEDAEQSLTNNSESESNSCLFIKVHIDEEGDVFLGCGHDFPTYTYSESQLISLNYVEISAPIRVIVGEGISYSGSEDGAVNGLYQVTEFPYPACDLNLIEMSNDTVTIDYHGKQFSLKPGNSWSNITVELMAPKYGRDAKIFRNTTIIKNHRQVELVIEGSPVHEPCYGIWC